MALKRCASCEHFRRLLAPDCTPRSSGFCIPLVAVLHLFNGFMFGIEDVQVPESFGCPLHRTRKDKSPL